VIRIDRLGHSRVGDRCPAGQDDDRDREAWRPDSEEMRQIVNACDVPRTAPPSTQQFVLLTSQRGALTPAVVP